MPARKTSTAKSAPGKTKLKQSASQVRRSAKKTEPEIVESSLKRVNFLPSLRGNYRWFVFLAVAAFLIILTGKFLVVAWVDKKPVTIFEFYNALNKRYGKDLREELIVEKLISDEAVKRKVTAGETEVNLEIKKIEDQQGGADKLNQILQIQNISREDLKKLVKLQLLRQKMFGSNIVISDEEVNKYIENNKQSLPTQTGELDDKTKTGIKEQLKNEKINEGFNKWLTGQLKSARVVRL